MQTEHFKPFNLWFLTAWFGASFTTLIFCIVFTFYLSTPRFRTPVNQSFKLYAAIPPKTSQISDKIDAGDARAKIIENFFKGYNSPLSSLSKHFVAVADKYQLNFRLLPSIAMQESNGGKKVVDNSFNPFGYGIYGKMVIKFSSWEEAIERVGKALKEDYLNFGLTTPDLIMIKYTPASVKTGGSWAKGVSSFMEELR